MRTAWSSPMSMELLARQVQQQRWPHLARTRNMLSSIAVMRPDSSKDFGAIQAIYLLTYLLDSRYLFWPIAVETLSVLTPQPAAC